jgi:ATP-dependent RNA helicase RhlE
MLDMGFIYDVRRIIGQTPPVRQTLLFSATMSQEVCSLAATIQKKPEYVAVAGSTAPAKTVAQTFISVPRQSKTDLLVHILKNEEVETMLVFSRTKHGADKIARKLCNCGITTAAIHSNRSMAQRARALDGFKKRQYRVLVATDLAARGIDVANISHVVNYDTPAFAEDYIHRIGRTGRAENAGTAFTFVSSEEEQYKTKIERMIGKRFDLKRYPGFKGDGHRHSPQPVRVSFSGHAVVAAAPAQKKAGWFRKITGRSAMN